MASFVPNTFDCFSDGTLNFFRNVSYGRSSFTASWTTATTPYVDTFNTPVYELVLQKYNIPYSFPNGTPRSGTLPGLNIRNMSAIEAIRLSLSESLLFGEWWDVVEDGSGGVFFQNVLGPSQKTVSLDIRSCIPVSSSTNKIDMVIVKGYDPPPIVEVRSFRDVVPQGTGQINPELVTGNENVFTVSPGHYLANTRHKSLATNTVYKSYPDPVFTSTFSPQEPNPFYDVKAFESILGYVIDIDGMPTDPEEAARVTYSFAETTKWYQSIGNPLFTEVTSADVDGTGTSYTVSYYQTQTSLTSPLYSDRYGTPWPLYEKPVEVVFTGNRLVAFNQLAIPSTTAFYNVGLMPLKEFASFSPGSNWNWSTDDGLNYDFEMYFQPDFLWKEILPLINDVDGRFRVTYIDEGEAVAAAGSYSTWSPNSIGFGGSLGYISDNMYVGWELDRPSVIISARDGNALDYAENLRVRYAPIVKTDRPAPIAYRHVDAGTKIVDQTKGLVDSDPTTCQNLEETDLEEMERLSEGYVLSTSLPFCATGEDCLQVADTIFEYMSHEQVTTYTLTCGPDSEPEIGAVVDGFSSDLRIESINYSFQDGSSYTIEVNLAPIFQSIGQWSLESNLLQTEDVTREAIVKWSAGDGTNYRVEVQGLGSFYAVNGVTGDNRVFYPGDRVQVTIYNIPKEKP